jgi:hypothetical protein
MVIDKDQHGNPVCAKFDPNYKPKARVLTASTTAMARAFASSPMKIMAQGEPFRVKAIEKHALAVSLQGAM